MEKYYLTVTGIENLSPDDYIKRSQELIGLAENPPQQMKDTYFPGFVSLLDRWTTAGENKAKEPATADNDKKRIIAIVNDLGDAKTNYIGRAKASKNNAPNNARPEVLKKDNQNKNNKDEGETFNVTKRNLASQPQTKVRPDADEKQKIKEDLNNLSGQTSRTQAVKTAVDEALELKDNEPVAKFIMTATLPEMNKELDEIRQALGLIDIANEDFKAVKPDYQKDLGNQMKRLEDLQRTILRSKRYQDLQKEAQETDLPPVPPQGSKPEKVEPEDAPLPQGQVEEQTTGFNENDPKVLEAREYVRKIKAVPSGQLPLQVNEILQRLEFALSRKNESELDQALQQARSYFSTADADMNRVTDNKERQGKAIDAGLEDFKKIEKEKKEAKDAKPKLEDLRATAEEGEEERVKKNFNKDILELTKANDVLKSQVNLQKEEIKILKETIEQKLKRENEEMLKGVAPVFRQYLQLDIDNVIKEDEMADEFYYSVL